jgi:hypothetical protein
MTPVQFIFLQVFFIELLGLLYFWRELEKGDSIVAAAIWLIADLILIAFTWLACIYFLTN